MRNRSVHARLTGYTATGTPVVAQMPNVSCLPGPDTLGARHAYYTAAGVSVAAYGWECCDGFCPDDVDDCYVRPDCWPPGPGPGISRVMVGYLLNVNSCPSADGVTITFVYDDVSMTWQGSDTLGGHTYTYTISCNPGDPSDPAKFTLTVAVDGGPPVGIGSGAAECLDPITITFHQIPPDGCLCGDTDTPAELDLTVRGNCRKVVFARHVGYTVAGIPVVARESDCFAGQPLTGCWLTCGLFAVVTADPLLGGDCACLESGLPYALAYEGAGPGWNYAGGFGCTGSPGTLDMTCGEDPDHPGKLCLTLRIVCAAAVTAVSVLCDIDPADLDTLDVTFDLVIDNTPTPCGGGCNYAYNAMLPGWQLTSDTCDPPECAGCGETPVSPPPDPADGQTLTETCPGSVPAECCKGVIHVRVTR